MPLLSSVQEKGQWNYRTPDKAPAVVQLRVVWMVGGRSLPAPFLGAVPTQGGGQVPVLGGRVLAQAQSMCSPFLPMAPSPAFHAAQWIAAKVLTRTVRAGAASAQP